MITVAGEAVIDLVDEGGGLYRAHPGGSAANAAVGLARLGVPCSILARLSTDALGGQLASHLAGNGVSLRDAVRAAEPTTLALASLDEAGRAAYSFYFQGTADWQWRRDELPGALAPDVTALHAGSMTLALAPGARAVEDLLAAERARGRVTISIDPNIRPHIAAGRADEVARVERQIRLAHIVKASEEDTDWLYPGLGYESVARAWQRLGPDLVVITLGARGAYALAPDGTRGPATRPAGGGRGYRRSRRRILRRPARRAVAARLARLRQRPARAARRGRKRGAGGAMPLGRIAAGDIAEVVDWAVLAASVTCERPGADPPTRQEMLQAR